MGESNTIVSAYTLYRHLQWYCSHPSIHCNMRSLKPWQMTHITKYYQKIYNIQWKGIPNETVDSAQHIQTWHEGRQPERHNNNNFIYPSWRNSKILKLGLIKSACRCKINAGYQFSLFQKSLKSILLMGCQYTKGRKATHLKCRAHNNQ